MTETVFYHVLSAKGSTYHTNEPVSVGTVIRAQGIPALCEEFPHASRRAIDAFRFRKGDFVFEGVLLRGNVVHGDDKSCANERETVWMLTAGQTLRVLKKWAWWCAKQAQRYAGYTAYTADAATYADYAATYTADVAAYAADVAAYAANAANAAAEAADAVYTDDAAAYADYAAALAADAAVDTAVGAADTAAREGQITILAALAALADRADVRAAAREEQNTELERLIALAVKGELM